MTQFIVKVLEKWRPAGPFNTEKENKPTKKEVIWVEETEGNRGHRNDAATYTMSPASRLIDAVRLEIGKEVSLKYLTDDEIGYCLGQARGNTLLAASYAAEKISGICADLADKSMGRI